MLNLLAAFGSPSCPPGGSASGGACTSKLTCAQLNSAYGGAWGNPAQFGSPDVCGESDNGFLGGGDGNTGGGNQCIGGQVDGGP